MMWLLVFISVVMVRCRVVWLLVVVIVLMLVLSVVMCFLNMVVVGLERWLYIWLECFMLNSDVVCLLFLKMKEVDRCSGVVCVLVLGLGVVLVCRVRVLKFGMVFFMGWLCRYCVLCWL